VVIGDGCSDRLATRILDLGLRAFRRRKGLVESAAAALS
jgi:hypothetical protein